ncbi:type II toxin-antitoxin system RelE/ParE family toxin [Nocardiopsis synnemataformans]|uniref:type II toxin-antitoxin system RelE/ParE family toxin n=1 Tax=Nocardiopsis synnemataformans TaxID=61305 RepID=UPI003EB86CB6
MSVSWNVILLDEVDAWLLNLAKEEPDLADRVVAAVNRLETAGPTLGRPLVDCIKGSTVHNMKELRPRTSGMTAVRILFVFDPARQAVLLVAGDKAGLWQRWYEENVPLAEERYQRWLDGGYGVERG